MAASHLIGSALGARATSPIRAKRVRAQLGVLGLNYVPALFPSALATFCISITSFSVLL